MDTYSQNVVEVRTVSSSNTTKKHPKYSSDTVQIHSSFTVCLIVISKMPKHSSDRVQILAKAKLVKLQCTIST